MSTKILPREKMLRKRLRRLHKLYDTALTYVLSLNAEYVLNHIVQSVGEILAIDHCYVMLVKPDAAHLTVQAAWQAPETPEDNPSPARCPVDESTPAGLERGHNGSPHVDAVPWAGILENLVVEHMSPMIIPDTATYPDLRLEASDQRLPASMVAIPLTFRDKVIGTLTVASNERRTFDPEEVVALSQLATPASMSIENERLYTSLRERLKEKETLLEGNASMAQANARLMEDERRQGEQRSVLLEAARLAASSLNVMGTLDGFAELCARCLGAERALIFQVLQARVLELSAAHGIDPQQEMDFLQALPLDLDRETLCRQAIDDGREVFHEIQNGAELGPSERMLATCCDARALSAWPLCSPKGVGLVLLLFTTPPLRQPAHLDTMDGVMRQMGIFLQNTCLFEEVRLRAEQMQAISDITEAINATHDLPSIFSIVARNTQRVVPSDWTGLALVERDKNLLRLPVVSVRGDLHREETLTFPLDESLVHHAAVDGRPVISDGLVSSRSAFEKHLYDEGLRSLLIVPLVVDRKTVATLNLASRRPGAFTSNQVEILQHMADHLATAIKNANMFEEITRMNQELRRMDEVKSDFLSTVAHELRTPLTIIKGYLFILQRPQGLSEFVLETLDTIDSQTDHLKELIENLLSLSKLEANKGVLIPNMQSVRMSELVEEVVGNFKLSARKKGVELKIDVAPDIVLKADRVMLVRVLYNLVGNALKFTHEGRITISARPIEGGRMICEIEDTGSGIAAEHLSRIFERFYHVDAKDQRAPTGTGLGLAIVESIVHAHGGRVWVNSELGKGTRITFVLPLQPTGVPARV